MVIFCITPLLTFFSIQWLMIQIKKCIAMQLQTFLPISFVNINAPLKLTIVVAMQSTNLANRIKKFFLEIYGRNIFYICRLLTPRWTCQYFSLREKLSERSQSTFWGKGYNLDLGEVISYNIRLIDQKISRIFLEESKKHLRPYQLQHFSC